MKKQKQIRILDLRKVNHTKFKAIKFEVISIRRTSRKIKKINYKE